MGNERPLAALVQGHEAVVHGDGGVVVGGIAYDSRRVRAGDLFIAVPGFRHDGLTFVPEALQRGAVAVVSESRPEALGTASWVEVAAARTALAWLACAWYGDPSHHLQVLGVTGTNGKTTVTALLEALMATLGPSGRWSTTLVRYGTVRHDTPRTTPEAPELQAALAGMVHAGCRSAVIEVSSHALALERIAGTRFAGAAFTNLSRDHLDFHHDMDSYLDAKARLFASLPAGAPAVLNLSDEWGRKLRDRTSGRVVGYGWPGAPRAAYVLDGFTAHGDGSDIVLATPAGRLRLRTPLLGRANAENIAAAVALAIESGVDAESVAEVIAGFGGEPGRLEPVEAGQPFRVLVDFAHTPGALRAALDTARAITRGGRVLVVFGCGGDRDRSKRPLMGAIAGELADLVYVTSDNPRSESPEAIVDEILAGVPSTARDRVVLEVDRAAAIDRAVADAEPGDCVLIAGKGHEREQTFADRTIPFDDRAVARRSIEHVDVVGGAG